MSGVRSRESVAAVQNLHPAEVMFPPRVSTLILRVMLLAAGLACALIALGVAGGRFGSLTRQGLLFLIIAPSAVAATLGYVAIWQRHRVAGWQPARIARRLACEIFFLGMALVAVETLIAIWAPASPSQQLERKSVADKLGIPFDIRTTSEVMAHLRQQHIDAVPGLTRYWPRGELVRGRIPDGFYPLSNASRASVVECNEAGQYLVYRTDEFGFNNPPGLLASHDIRLAALGESLTLGHCVPPAQSVIDLLRRRYPRTGNFGMAGSYSLSLLATFREYVEPLQPPLVLWSVNPFYVGDQSELDDPVLVRYLDPGFTQNLRARQPEVDRIVRDIAVPARYDADRAARLAIERAEADRYLRIPLLLELRARRYLSLWRSPSKPVELQLFTQVLSVAQATTRRWGGEFVVLLLPTYGEIVANSLPLTLGHEHLKKVLTHRGILVIDGVDLFRRHSDPAALFTMRINNHPTPEGHAALASFVASELERRLPQRRAALR
jgi:hypothetical protein